MAISIPKTFIFIFVFIFFTRPRVLESTRTFTIVNTCKDTIWPAITPGGNVTGGGFSLKRGESAVYTIPDSWTGRIWARTGCDFDKDGNGKCRTGSCGEVLNCTGPGSRPATLADFTLGSIDYYDVSVVDGFNLPIAIQPSGGKGNCSSGGCDGDLRDNCPPELAVKDDGKVVACRSACDVFHTGEYCCTGQFDNPMTCLPTNYSRSFKQVCPAAYSFGYDDPTSILTCSSADYVVAFCATRNQKVCSYDDKQLKCKVESSKASTTLLTISQRWQNFFFTFLFIFILFAILF
ncbi:pathogenesis-related thaumatin-like protein 3.5 [Cucumis sativus]|uniref:Thaumatin-like protein n=1 Tax=Cucumis sativus TaxID=3659 RepID=A0A0A0LAB7_CUCSA|nr:pathogenesis-related thaumatin-like protein 3.5 [Cucumis sativus]